MIVTPRREPETKPSASGVVLGFDFVKELSVGLHASAVEANKLTRAGFHTEIYVMAIFLNLGGLCTQF